MGASSIVAPPSAGHRSRSASASGSGGGSDLEGCCGGEARGGEAGDGEPLADGRLPVEHHDADEGERDESEDSADEVTPMSTVSGER